MSISFLLIANQNARTVGAKGAKARKERAEKGSVRARDRSLPSCSFRAFAPFALSRQKNREAPLSHLLKRPEAAHHQPALVLLLRLRGVLLGGGALLSRGSADGHEIVGPPVPVDEHRA